MMWLRYNDLVNKSMETEDTLTDQIDELKAALAKAKQNAEAKAKYEADLAAMKVFES